MASEARVLARVINKIKWAAEPRKKPGNRSVDLTEYEAKVLLDHIQKLERTTGRSHD